MQCNPLFSGVSACPEKGVSHWFSVGNRDPGEQTELTALLPALLVATRRGSRLPSAFTVNKSTAVHSVLELVPKPEGSQQSLSPCQPLVHTKGICTVHPHTSTLPLLSHRVLFGPEAAQHEVEGA